LAIDPNYKNALSGKGFALAELGKYSEGLVFIDKALALDSENADASDSKGFALDGLGRLFLEMKQDHTSLRAANTFAPSPNTSVTNA